MRIYSHEHTCTRRDTDQCTHAQHPDHHPLHAGGKQGRGDDALRSRARRTQHLPQRRRAAADRRPSESSTICYHASRLALPRHVPPRPDSLCSVMPGRAICWCRCCSLARCAEPLVCASFRLIRLLFKKPCRCPAP
eukprot:6203745-Pleurochrysis_carterae.AAC.2